MYISSVLPAGLLLFATLPRVPFPFFRLYAASMAIFLLFIGVGILCSRNAVLSAEIGCLPFRRYGVGEISPGRM